MIQMLSRYYDVVVVTVLLTLIGVQVIRTACNLEEEVEMQGTEIESRDGFPYVRGTEVWPGPEDFASGSIKVEIHVLRKDGGVMYLYSDREDDAEMDFEDSQFSEMGFQSIAVYKLHKVIKGAESEEVESGEGTEEP